MTHDRGEDRISGRSCRSKRCVEKCFQFAFENLEPTDGVIVGMSPVHYDEVHDNAEHTREFGAA